jgi:hypothetical protein
MRPTLPIGVKKAGIEKKDLGRTTKECEIK